MKTNEKYGAYEAPKVEVIEVEVERGFQASGGNMNLYTTPDNNGGWS